MVEMTMNKETSHWWWFDSHYTSSGSPWLQSTLAGKNPPPPLFFYKKINSFWVFLYLVQEKCCYLGGSSYGFFENYRVR
jgi:hypothetical protein